MSNKLIKSHLDVTRRARDKGNGLVKAHFQFNFDGAVLRPFIRYLANNGQ